MKMIPHFFNVMELYINRFTSASFMGILAVFVTRRWAVERNFSASCNDIKTAVCEV
jgi:hypothetical protein